MKKVGEMVDWMAERKVASLVASEVAWRVVW